MLRIIILIAPVILLAAAGLAAAEGRDSPGVLIVYTGNSLGKYDPCPSCDGGESIGGLARRAAAFSALRESHPASSVFVLAGGNEFLPILPVEEPSARETKFTARAYGLMEYDLVCLTEEEAERLEGNGAEYLPDSIVFGKKPETRIIARGDAALGLVIFPDTGNPMDEPDKNAMNQVLEAARALRGETDLVVGISTLGEPLEKRFLEDYPGAVDVLLGGGFGSGSGLRVLDSGALWVRPEFNGWSVQALGMLASPEAGATGRREGGNHEFESISLDEEIGRDPAIAALMKLL
jgi:hypothetical protein